ncbi:hypothetical protein, conserved [Trypanosoma brucei gambiense DAL972]|uniref:AN1-type domain-containing protein n=1 Tax=Trypanosoma brucei gambiense (strain MHOM/CI/86/DAL972) TaxID=679716 RepID=D0A5C1_TRYB9|nr:hypothetical protein, conserved [Trypanosoma brucei gambiense DAL972]CBH16465.1 hypothetical protein, conserved [Trypanosoma brucei gambiense DAL972]|eukprot:XP_011778729.1 hypothetical protein, conserved [Trypanosoma brucei gambiense DAL972]
MQVGVCDDESKRCTFSGCGHISFLAARCGFCGEMFCPEHTSVGSHNCCAFGVQPLRCERCGMVVQLEYCGQSAAEAMARHTTSGCQPSQSPGTKEGQSNRCSYRECQKNEHVTIICDDCGNTYCVEHRAPQSHRCKRMHVRQPVPESRPTPSYPTVASNAKYGPRNTERTAFGRPTEGCVTPLVVFAEGFGVSPFFIHFTPTTVVGRMVDSTLSQAELESRSVSSSKRPWRLHVVKRGNGPNGLCVSSPSFSDTLEVAGISGGTIAYIGTEDSVSGTVQKELLKLLKKKSEERGRKKSGCWCM